MKVVGHFPEPICACGKNACRPLQRTCKECHATQMREARKGEHARSAFERMQRIWAMVRSGTYPNASDMAACMEVSTKSIHRDLEFMRERLGFDIQYDDARHGYFTPPGPVCCPFCNPTPEPVQREQDSGEPVEIFKSIKARHHTHNRWLTDEV